MVNSQSPRPVSSHLRHLTLHRGDLTDGEKSSYINAVLCLTKKPSKLNQTKYPGAKTRYDDFVAVHMNQTLNIHGTV